MVRLYLLSCLSLYEVCFCYNCFCTTLIVGCYLKVVALVVKRSIRSRNGKGKCHMTLAICTGVKIDSSILCLGGIGMSSFLVCYVNVVLIVVKIPLRRKSSTVTVYLVICRGKYVLYAIFSIKRTRGPDIISGIDNTVNVYLDSRLIESDYMITRSCVTLVSIGSCCCVTVYRILVYISVLCIRLYKSSDTYLIKAASRVSCECCTVKLEL